MLCIIMPTCSLCICMYKQSTQNIYNQAIFLIFCPITKNMYFLSLHACILYQHTRCTLFFISWQTFGLAVAEKPRSSYQEHNSLSWLTYIACRLDGAKGAHLTSVAWNTFLHMFFNTLINSETNTNHADTSRNLLG